MAFEYGSENRWHDQYFGKNVTVEADGTECPERLAVGEHHGALAVTVAAAAARSRDQRHHHSAGQ